MDMQYYLLFNSKLLVLFGDKTQKNKKLHHRKAIKELLVQYGGSLYSINSNKINIITIMKW